MEVFALDWKDWEAERGYAIPHQIIVYFQDTDAQGVAPSKVQLDLVGRENNIPRYRTILSHAMGQSLVAQGIGFSLPSTMPEKRPRRQSTTSIEERMFSHSGGAFR